MDSRTPLMGDTGNVYTLDEALEIVGFGKYQALLLVYGALGWIGEAMEMMILSFIGAAVQAEWNLTPAQKSLISTMVFAGMLVGASFWGIISDNFGRKKAMLGVSIVTSVAGLLSAFAPNYVSLVILRCVAGAGLGGMHNFNSWFLEFVPIPNRGAWMIVFSSFWTVGSIMEAGLAWAVMPKLGWRWLLGLSAAPSFIVLFLYAFVPESPRYLCMKGRIAEAGKVLEKAATFNGKTLIPGRVVVEQMQEGHADEFDESNYKSSPSILYVLFSSKLIRTNLLLWFLYFGNTFSYYGIVLLTSELSSDQSKCATEVEHKHKAMNLYLDVFVTTLAEVPGMMIAAFVVDRVGRKLCMIIMFVISAVLLSPLLTHQNEVVTTGLLFGARALISSSFIVATIYCPEVYPTSIRGTAVGLASGIGRIGGMICPLVAVSLVGNCHQMYAVILFQVVIILSALSVLLSPFETRGRNLTDVLVVE